MGVDEAGSRSLVQGPIARTLAVFTLPMMGGALLQQSYNLADMAIVGRFIGPHALAAVGAGYALIVLLVSVVQGLSMGCGTVFSQLYGAGRAESLRRSIFVAAVWVGGLSLLLQVSVLLCLDAVLAAMQIPVEVYGMLHGYLQVVLGGFFFVFLYNFLTAVLRSVGDAVRPLYFLGVSVVLNIILDWLCVVVLGWGLAGAAWATVAAQGAAAVGLLVYVCRVCPALCPRREDMCLHGGGFSEIVSFSGLACVQQSVMNFGILMIQSLVNSFGTVVMAAFAVAVKIDAFAYMPVQEFGNAFSVFAAQNYGAGLGVRIRRGFRIALCMSAGLSLFVSVLVWLWAQPLMMLFVGPDATEVLAVGTEYLRIEGVFYAGIGVLFLFYGYYRAIRVPVLSVVLTVVSLGSRVALAYALAPVDAFGVRAIWWSIPVGWLLADAVGFFYYRRTVGRVEALRPMMGGH